MEQAEESPPVDPSLRGDAVINMVPAPGSIFDPIHAPKHEQKHVPTRRSLPRFAPGYPRLAAVMSCGGNLGIFRKFDRMAYGSILQQQAQLLGIEKEIDDMDKMDDELILLDSFMEKTNNVVSRGPIGTLGELLNEVNDKSSRSDDNQQMPGQDRWIDIVFEYQPEDDGVIHSRVALRGVWTGEKEDIDTVAFSIVLDSETPGLGPCVIWGRFPNKSRYPLVAGWEFTKARKSGLNTPLKMHSWMGDEFSSHMYHYVRDYNDYEASGQVRLFLKFSPKPSEQHLNFMVNTSSGRVYGRCIPHLHDNFQQQEVVTYEQTLYKRSTAIPETLAGAIESMAEQRFTALRDGNLMERSPRHEDIARVDALNRLERKLAVYRSALIQHMQLARFGGPSTRGLTTLRHWFWGEDKKREKPEDLPLQGLAKDIYSQKERIDDLVTVSPLDKQDKLSFLIDFIFASKLKKKGDPPMEDLGETFFYPETWVESIVSWIGIVLAAGLLIGAIVGLDQLESKNARMGTICALTVSFALVLFITTTSTRGEIFGASAAYAAVLVVYVGGALDK